MDTYPLRICHVSVSNMYPIWDTAPTWRIGLASTSMTWWLAETKADVSLMMGECA